MILISEHDLDRVKVNQNVKYLVYFYISRESQTTRNILWSRHAHLCVCVSVCLCVCLSVRGRMPTLLHGPHPDVTWRSGRGCPLVVHYWADLQSVHGLRCYSNRT